MLRMSMSRCSTAKIDPADEAVSRIPPAAITKFSGGYDNTHNFKNQAQHGQPSSDNFNGGPPCDMYNSAQGCSLQSGHMV